MRRLNNKGFTLIELLAVVVIMGILMIVAIPAVTKYINNSKKDVFADTASAYINAARYSLLNDEYDCQAPSSDGEAVNILLKDIDIDKGNGKSTYGNDYTSDSYVYAEYSNGKINYSICLMDTKYNGTAYGIGGGAELISESELGRKKIYSDAKYGSCTSLKHATVTCSKNIN